MTFHPDSLPDLSGKTYIVTGGSSGIGYTTVARLAQHKAHVYMCARSPSNATAAIQRIQSLYPNARITFLEMDHLSLASVVSAAERFLSTEPALHGLVNNAGIMATPFEMTPDGHEAQWQTNYLAHWVFTDRLLPLLRRSARALLPGSVRVVNLSSSGHYGAPTGGVNFEDPALRDASGMTRYGQSKLANILHAKTLHRQYGPGSDSASAGEGEVWLAIVHPGLVESRLGERAEFPVLLRKLFEIYGALGGRVNADTGSWTSLFCVASPAMKREQSGTYFQRIAEAGWQSGMAKDTVLAERLENWTREVMAKEGWV
ncbi:uncharacterized protein KD926_001655 [Aspergillus affinis]|uniref:uncharacterized protein n=1 Tax=Aspergillus affinis TaxID=1070780 RepID=UPI0022FEE1E3|nr:uncharacterized protein KD926_001655 [Aspergillus affinis]KAI9036581.1 hypothetical protein KD926_001655 [Aspergillus affinis]